MCKTIKDDLRREVSFGFPPRRVVCLCPSLTETLFALGLDETIVGRTWYCIHPAGRVQDVATVGGTQDVDLERVRALGPDLVIAAKEENPEKTVLALAETLPVFVFDVTDYQSALRAVMNLGELTDRAARAEALVRDIREAFAELRPHDRHTVAYLVWASPYMAAGRGTYIHALLEKCGLENVYVKLAGRYPEASVESLRELRPQFNFLSSEPFHFDDSHVARLATQVPAARLIRVDGEMFAWYGSRMLLAAEYLRQLIGELGETSMG